jgi:hypothetical protein
MIVIPIGSHCSILNALKQIDFNQVTHLFDFIETLHINDITYIINKCIINNENPIIEVFNRSPSQNGIFIENKNIFTWHYNIQQYNEIFNRRKNRFIDNINSNDKILFIRLLRSKNFSKNQDDKLLPPLRPFDNEIITENDMNLFIKSLIKINKNINYEILILGNNKETINDNLNNIEHVKYITYDYELEDDYFRKDVQGLNNTLFLDMLKKIINNDK